MPPVLHSVLLLVPSAARAALFYGGALGLPLLTEAAGWQRLSLGGAVELLVQEAPALSAPSLSVPAPVLQLRVRSSRFDELLPALLGAGGTLEAPIEFLPAGRLCVVRAPVDAGGHLLSLRASDADDDVNGGGSGGGLAAGGPFK